MSRRKINKAQKNSPWGRFPRTWKAILDTIPPDLISTITAKQLVVLIDACQKFYHFGQDHSQAEINDFLGFNLWKIDLDNSKIVLKQETTC